MDYKGWLASLGDSLAEFGHRVAQQLPNVLGALALVALGWLIAWLLRRISLHVVGRVTRMVSSRSLQSEMRQAGVDQLAPRLVAGFVFWAVLLFFVAAAIETLELTILISAVSRLALYLPDILAGLVIVLAGLILANLARSAVVSASTTAGIAHGELIGRAVRLVILLLAAVVALDQVGIDSNVLNVMILIAAGAMLGGAALAFGLGARGVVGNLLSVHYAAQTYRAGQVIRVGTFEGRIVEFANTGIVLETRDGQVLVPGRNFGRSASLLIDGAGRS